MGVSYCVIFDPQLRISKRKLRAYRREGRVYVPSPTLVCWPTSTPACNSGAVATKASKPSGRAGAPPTAHCSPPDAIEPTTNSSGPTRDGSGPTSLNAESTSWRLASASLVRLSKRPPLMLPHPSRVPRGHPTAAPPAPSNGEPSPHPTKSHSRPAPKAGCASGSRP